jgi:hypothetical protein
MALLELPAIGGPQSNAVDAQGDRPQIVIGALTNSPSIIAVPAETSWTGTISFGASPAEVMDSSNLQTWLNTRRSENGLASVDLPPWHIVITYDQFDEDGDNVHSGVVEEFWAGPKRSKVSFKSDNLSQIDFITDQGLYRAGDQRWQNRTESEVGAAVIDPFSNAAMLQGLHVTKIERSFGNHKLSCDVFARMSGGISSPNQYCTDTKDSALRYVRGPGWWQIAYNDIVSFSGHFVARNVEVTDGGRPFLKLRVTKLELLDHPDEKEFAPGTSAVKLSGTRVSGVSITPLKSVPIDASAVTGLSKFQVDVQIVIGKDGKVIEAKAISGPKEAYKAAEAAARKWVYVPYLVAGQPTEVETKISFTKL